MKTVLQSLALLSAVLAFTSPALAKDKSYDNPYMSGAITPTDGSMVVATNDENGEMNPAYASSDNDGIPVATPHSDVHPGDIAWRQARSVPPEQDTSGNASTMTMTQTETRPMAAERDADAYGIEPGDVLQISVWKEDALDREVVVLPDGKINFPLIGSVSVLNKSLEDVQADIKTRLHKYIPDASVSVVVKADLGHTVSVIGQVTKPGELIMSHHLSVMMALSQAGGLTPYAKQSRILILRRASDGKETAIRFPYGDVVDGDDLDKDIYLQPGDVVVVPTAGLF